MGKSRRSRQRPAHRAGRGTAAGQTRGASAGPRDGGRKPQGTCQAGVRQLPDALRRTRPDQVGDREQRLRDQGHQLRPARQLPRHRHRLPERPDQARLPALDAGGAAAARVLRARVPGDPADAERPAPVPGPARHPGAAAAGQPRRGLPAGDRRDGGPRPGHGPAVRPLPAAARLPVRHPRQPRRDRGVHRAVLPRPAAGHLGLHRLRRAAGPARPPDPVVADPRRRGRRDPAAAGVGPPGAGVVALQQAVVQPDARARPGRCTCPRTTSPTRRPVRWP